MAKIFTVKWGKEKIDIPLSKIGLIAYVNKKYDRISFNPIVDVSEETAVNRFSLSILDLLESNTDKVYFIPKESYHRKMLWDIPEYEKESVLEKAATYIVIRENLDCMPLQYYTYGYEDFKGNVGKVTVAAHDSHEAYYKLHTYHVSKGQLYQAWLLSISKTGKEKYYEDKKSKQAMGLLVVAFVVALGHTQISNYGDYGDLREAIKKALSDEETQYILKH